MVGGSLFAPGLRCPAGRGGMLSKKQQSRGATGMGSSGQLCLYGAFKSRERRPDAA